MPNWNIETNHTCTCSRLFQLFIPITSVHLLQFSSCTCTVYVFDFFFVRVLAVLLLTYWCMYSWFNFVAECWINNSENQIEQSIETERGGACSRQRSPLGSGRGHGPSLLLLPGQWPPLGRPSRPTLSGGLRGQHFWSCREEEGKIVNIVDHLSIVLT